MATSSAIRDPRDPLHRLYTIMASVFSVVYLCLFFVIVSKAPVWRVLLMISALLVAPVSLMFYGEVLKRHSPPFKPLWQLLFGLAGAQLLLLAVAGPSSTVVVWINGAIVFGGLALHIRAIAKLFETIDRPIEAERVRYLLVAGVVAAVLMGLEMAAIEWARFQAVSGRRSALTFPPLGTLTTALYIYYLGQITVRNRLLDRMDIIARAVVFVVMSAVMVVVYGVVVRGFSPEAGSFTEAVNLLLATVLILILYEPVKIAVESRLVPLFDPPRYETLGRLRGRRRALSGVIEIGPLVDTLCDEEHFAGRVELLSVYLYDEFRGGFRLRRQVGQSDTDPLPVVPAQAFGEGEHDAPSWFLLEDLEREAERPGGGAAAAVVAAVRSLQADLVLPLRLGHTTVGLWALRARPGTGGYREEELAALAAVAHQAAVLIDNSKAFDRLKERDRLATLGEMSAGLAHEIRNPLGAIKGATQVLSRKVKQTSSGQAEEFLAIIVEEVDRLNAVVGQFLDYARPQTLHVDPIDPDLLLSSLMAMVRAEGVPENVEVRYEPTDGVPPVPMDMERVKQVMLNLMRNGVESMARSGGTLRVRTRLRDGEGTRIPSLRAASPASRDVRVKRGSVGDRACVEIIVQDEGEGIDPADASKLFIPFFTTKTGGTGLGLAISERILREHGGELEIESVRGKGSAFTLRLPLSR